MRYLGVAVAKNTLEVADASGKQRRSFPNTRAGIQALLHWLVQDSCPGEWHLVLEPTSTYHHPLVVALAAQRAPYTLINPAHTAAFARVQGKRAKTDRVDARLLAALGESQQPEPTQPPQGDQEGLRATRRHLEWLEQELQRAHNRLETARFSPWTPQAVLQSLERTIQQLEEEARQVREALERQQQAHPDWTVQMKPLTSIPGVGKKTALLLLSALPPVTSCSSARSWAAFCGLNPEPSTTTLGISERASRRFGPHSMALRRIAEQLPLGQSTAKVT